MRHSAHLHGFAHCPTRPNGDDRIPKHRCEACLPEAPPLGPHRLETDVQRCESPPTLRGVLRLSHLVHRTVPDAPDRCEDGRYGDGRSIRQRTPHFETREDGPDERPPMQGVSPIDLGAGAGHQKVGTAASPYSTGAELIREERKATPPLTTHVPTASR